MDSVKKSCDRPRRFAPLNPEKAKSEEHEAVPQLQGIIFDVDGTLCEPQNYMFREMRAALDIPKTVDILDHIYTLPTAEAQEEAHEKIKAIERRAMVIQQPQAGLLPLMDYLQSRGMQKALLTRNFNAPVQHLLGKFLVGYKFEPVITRDFRPPKPHPAGILHIAKSWGLEDGGSRLIMVGDSIDDMTAGHEAGAATVLLANDANAHLAEHQHTDLVISRLDELIEILEGGFVGNGNSEKTKTGEQVEQVANGHDT